MALSAADPYLSGRWKIEQGLANNTITALLQNRQGYLWLATPSGLLRFDGRQFRCSNRWNTPAMTVDRLTCLWLDNDDTIWIGSDGGGLYYLRKNQWGTVPQKLSNPHVQTILRDRRGALWIGTQYGLNCLRDDRLETFTMSQGLPGNLVYALAEAEDGTLLAGSDGSGLAALRNGKFVVENRVDAPEGIRALRRGHDGTVRIAAENGLFTWHRRVLSRVAAVPRQKSLLALLEDRAGRWWLGSEGEGIFLLENNRLLSVAADSQPVYYVPSLLEDHEGNIWAGTISQGLLQFREKSGAAATQPLSLQIETVLADNRPVTGQPGVVLPRSTRLLEFYFTAVAFRRDEQLKLQYRLQGWESGWHSVSGQAPRNALYSNLRPGHYTFQVRFENGGRRQQQNEAMAAFSFRIGTPFFLSPLLAALLFTAAALSVFLLWRRRRRVHPPVPVSGNVSAGQPLGENQKKYATSALTDAVACEVEQRLLALMEKEEAWLDPDLTLKKLAEMLHIHPNYLSQIMNERLGRSARDFINTYRIAAAEKMLLDPKQKKKTILEIAFETGFYSKSVFNSAFKKFNGRSPQEYRGKKS
ncbi:MAG TPA: two-component regulator propeller domain-containing protein [Patescibacteria group bacterium]|nr:two-component regulator propeller domain-containing protein [Patescibacteria group bacterium]